MNKDCSSSRPRKSFEAALKDFLDMSKEQSQNIIIKYFLEQIVTRSDLCEQGSLLVHDANKERLCLYQMANNANSVARWPRSETQFPIDKGLGGLAFRKRTPVFAESAVSHPDFVSAEGSDIGSIYCLPIFRKDEPFCVVSFHNPVGGKVITSEEQLKMQVAVSVLEAQLQLSPISLVPQEKVFIVHGHDDSFLHELELILRQAKVYYVVIQALARTGQDLLSFIEERIGDCVAGFVLLTPDDEGRLFKFGEPMRQRARQNVIFEGGYLTALFRRKNRICFLQKGDIEIPSDLNGLLMERFVDRIDSERVLLTLSQWGLADVFRAAPQRVQDVAASSADVDARNFFATGRLGELNAAVESDGFPLSELTPTPEKRDGDRAPRQGKRRRG